MAFTFSELQNEVARRSTRNQGGDQFTTGIKNAINTSMKRIAREAKWRSLRRETTFTTKTTYSTGSGAVSVTNGSTSVTVTGATLLTDGIRIGRYVKFSGSVKYFKIATITGETTFTLDQSYDGTTSTTATYTIMGQEEYMLPIQVGHSAFFWHRAYGYPIRLDYVPTFSFYDSGVIDTLQAVPLVYRMWGVSAALEQPKAASVITIASSSSSDVSISCTIFGTVSGYPDYEIITTNSTNGTTASAGSKSFTSVERFVCNSTRVGRITATANSGNTTVGVLPVGNTTTGPYYTKVQLFPLPNQVIPINVLYYKLPYELVNDGDVPEIGEDFSEAIILLSVAKINAEQNKKEDADFFKLYQDEIINLKTTNVDKIDWNPELLRAGHGTKPHPFQGVFSPMQVGGSGLYGYRSRY